MLQVLGILKVIWKHHQRKIKWCIRICFKLKTKVNSLKYYEESPKNSILLKILLFQPRIRRLHEDVSSGARVGTHWRPHGSGVRTFRVVFVLDFEQLGKNVIITLYVIVRVAWHCRNIIHGYWSQAIYDFLHINECVVAHTNHYSVVSRRWIQKSEMENQIVKVEGNFFCNKISFLRAKRMVSSNLVVGHAIVWKSKKINLKI